MVWAWSHNDLSSTETFVLLALADHANDDGLCWPGQKGLADKTKLARSSIQQVIGRLKDKGKLEIIPRQDPVGRPLANLYQLCVSQGGKAHVLGVGVANVLGVNPNEVGTNLHIESSKKEPSGREDIVPPPESEKFEPSDLVEAWNEYLTPVGLPKVDMLSATRKMKASRRLAEHPEDKFWSTVMYNIQNSTFLRGLSKPRKPDERPFKASFDWLIDNDTNVVKVYEGRYNGNG